MTSHTPSSPFDNIVPRDGADSLRRPSAEIWTDIEKVGVSLRKDDTYKSRSVNNDLFSVTGHSPA